MIVQPVAPQCGPTHRRLERWLVSAPPARDKKRASAQYPLPSVTAPIRHRRRGGRARRSRLVSDMSGPPMSRRMAPAATDVVFRHWPCDTASQPRARRGRRLREPAFVRDRIPRCDGVSRLVRSLRPLLAVGLVGPGTVSDRLASPAALSHRRHRGRGCPGTRPRDRDASGPSAAWSASVVTIRRPPAARERSPLEWRVLHLMVAVRGAARFTYALSRTLRGAGSHRSRDPVRDGQCC